MEYVENRRRDMERGTLGHGDLGLDGAETGDDATNDEPSKSKFLMNLLKIGLVFCFLQII